MGSIFVRLTFLFAACFAFGFVSSTIQGMPSVSANRTPSPRRATYPTLGTAPAPFPGSVGYASGILTNPELVAVFCPVPDRRHQRHRPVRRGRAVGHRLMQPGNVAALYLRNALETQRRQDIEPKQPFVFLNRARLTLGPDVQPELVVRQLFEGPDPAFGLAFARGVLAARDEPGIDLRQLARLIRHDRPMLAQRSAIASSMTLIAREAQKLLSTFGLAHVARGFHL